MNRAVKTFKHFNQSKCITIIYVLITKSNIVYRIITILINLYKITKKITKFKCNIQKL